MSKKATAAGRGDEALIALGARPNVSLAPFTWLKVGGCAEWFLEAEDITVLEAALAAASSRGMQVTLLGKGANVLVDDAGVPGLVVRLTGDFRTIRPMGQDRLYAGGGAMLVDLAKTYQKANRSGLEWSMGIPATVGGAVFMNAGIGKQAGVYDTAGVVESVEVVAPSGPQGLTRKVIPNAECGFAYRTSRFQTSGEVVVGAVFRLGEGPWDRDRARTLSDYRTRTQPYDKPNFGSVFTNPPGDHAARLIEAAGLKGHRVGNAAFSEKHANFIVNLGGAKASDVRALIRLAQETVREKFGVSLETEVRFLGGESAAVACR